MTALHKLLQERFGADKVQEFTAGDQTFPLLLINLKAEKEVTLIMTNGLSDYQMPVPKKYEGHEFNELYFCLPSYWNLEDPTDINANWVFTWIDKMANFVVTNKTWFGTGHTIPNGKELLPLSERMKQNHFLLSYPIFLSNELDAMQLNEKTIHFLAIIPIFQDEMEFKEAKGTFKIIEEFINAGISEKLDDFRESTLKSKWNLLRKIPKFRKK
ncbi:MAG: suppressor of fused domain protein [Bacteroidota bacterium]